MSWLPQGRQIRVILSALRSTAWHPLIQHFSRRPHGHPRIVGVTVDVWSGLWIFFLSCSTAEDGMRKH